MPVEVHQNFEKATIYSPDALEMFLTSRWLSIYAPPRVGYALKVSIGRCVDNLACIGWGDDGQP